VNSFCVLALLMILLLPHLPFYYSHIILSFGWRNCVEWRVWVESKKLSNIIATQLCTRKRTSQQQRMKSSAFYQIKAIYDERRCENSLTDNGYESQHDKFSTPFTFALSHYLIRISLLFVECIVIDWACLKIFFVYQQI